MHRGDQTQDQRLRQPVHAAIDENLARLLQILDELAPQKWQTFCFAAADVFRVGFADQHPGMIEKAEALIDDQIFLAVIGYLDVDLLGLAHALEAAAQPGKQYRERGAGEAEQAERLGAAAPLRQAEFAILAEAF